MKKETLDKESLDKRDKKFQRIFIISILIAILGGIFFVLFQPDLEEAIMLLLMFVFVFQVFIFVWIFQLQYHLVPKLKKDSDENMQLENMD